MAILNGEEVYKVVYVDDSVIPVPVFQDIEFPGKVPPSSGGSYDASVQGEWGFMGAAAAATAVTEGSVMINVDNTLLAIEQTLIANA